MVNYWMFLTNEENWAIVKKKRIWGAKPIYLNKFKRLCNGDYVVVYVKSKRLGGIFKIVNGKIPKKEVFKGGLYPFKVRLAKVIVAKELVILDKEIISVISLFRNKHNWGSHLMGKAIIRLNKGDFSIFKRALKDTAN